MRGRATKIFFFVSLAGCEARLQSLGIFGALFRSLDFARRAPLQERVPRHSSTRARRRALFFTLSRVLERQSKLSLSVAGTYHAIARDERDLTRAGAGPAGQRQDCRIGGHRSRA